MRFVQFSKIVRDGQTDSTTDTDDVGENTTAPTDAVWQPCIVNVEAIRCFYPRRDNRPGTRLTFTDGGGFAVREDFDTVRETIFAN